VPQFVAVMHHYALDLKKASRLKEGFLVRRKRHARWGHGSSKIEDFARNAVHKNVGGTTRRMPMRARLGQCLYDSETSRTSCHVGGMAQTSLPLGGEGYSFSNCRQPYRDSEGQARQRIPSRRASRVVHLAHLPDRPQIYSHGITPFESCGRRAFRTRRRRRLERKNPPPNHPTYPCFRHKSYKRLMCSALYLV
jgi:hypothetical protein